ncbi:MAG: SDR family oxidoreductase [Bacteroidia bacterium]|nr:SDR family oxidoreductase [Bacteroidia bacterium]MDW8158181.1 SDR family oxidoreductase [Bacteroidia bacterium]
MKLKTVVVTGSNGLLGQKVVNLLAQRPAIELIATGLGYNRNPETKGYTYHSVDVTNSLALRKIFETYKPTEVIHTAAMTNVDACEKDPITCQKVNVEAVANLCELCKEFQTKLIHVSTDFIFDGKEGLYTEEAEPNPLSVYGKAKYEAEKIIISSSISYAIARTILLYGVAPNLSRTNIVLWIIQSLQAGKAIQVVSDQYRSPTLAEDLADGLVAILLKEKTGIYHLSGPEVMSILEIAYTVADYFELDKSLITPTTTAALGQPALRPPRTGFILLKANLELGYNPHSLRNGLAIVKQQLEDL